MIVVDTAAEGINVTAEGVQVEAGAVVVQLNCTGAANPAIGVVVVVVVFESPATTSPEVGFATIEKSTPLPVSEFVTGAKFAAVAVIVPVRAPLAVGVKPSVIVQLASEASVVPHVFDTAEKSPVAVTCGEGIAPGALFVSVTDFLIIAPISAFPKSTVPFDTARSGTPVPVSDELSVVPVDISVSDPVRAPSAVGLNATSISQLAPAPIEPHGADVITKSPLAVTEEGVSGKIELFFHIKACAAVAKPTASDP